MRDLYLDVEFDPWERDDPDEWNDYLGYYWTQHTLTPEEIAASLEEAADILEGNWCQSSWITTDEATDKVYRCVEGGLAAALGLDVHDIEGVSWERRKLTTCPVYNAVLDTLNAEYEKEYDDEGGFRELTDWNDDGSREEQDVLDLLHRTAKRVLGVEA